MSRDNSTLAVTADDLGTLGVSILSTIQRLRAATIGDEACVWMQQVSRNAAELCTRHGNRDLTDLAEKLREAADSLADNRRQPHILAQTARNALTALRLAGAAAGQAYLDEALQTALQATEDLAVEVQRSRQ